MKNITEECPDFKSFEKTLFQIMCRIACELISQYLEWCDRSIMGTRDTARYRHIGFRNCTVKTIFGEVPYSRRYYKDNQNGNPVFLLDQVLGIHGDYGLISENLAEQIVNECADKSFRKAVGSINGLTGQSISAQGAWNVVQQFGKAIGQQEERLAELSESGSVGHLGGVQSRVLFEEFDDVWIPRQREKRRKPGTAAKGAKKIGKKLGKRPMHIGTAYTGWEQSADGRFNTANKMAYASFGKVSEFTEKFEVLQNQCFDMDGIERRIINGDGESWIRARAEEIDSILQLDSFHRSQAIIRAVKDKSDRELLFDAISKKDVDTALATICELALDAEDERTLKKLAEFYGYFRNNRDILLTWQERGVVLPVPPEGISFRNMGVQESSNCAITQRMKHRRGSWSDSGGNNMAKILCYRSTIGLDAIMGILPEPGPRQVEVFADPLSAAQSPQHDGKGYGADWLRAPMPFDNAFRTHGREAIRGMLRMKPVSALHFI